MGYFRDITNCLKNIGKAAGAATQVLKQGHSQLNTLRGTSLSKLSSAATLQFPIIISRSVNVDTAQSVCKALERQFANFVQIVISLDPNINLDRDENITGYLRKYHQNKVGLGDLLESCMNVYTDETIGLAVLMSINEGCNAQILNSNKEQMFCVEDCLNKNSINNLYQPKTISLSVAETTLEYFCKKNNILLEGPYSIPLTDDRYKDEREYKERRDKIADNFQERRIYAEEEKLKHEIERDGADFRSRTVVKLADNDVKKSNELVPTTLSVTLNQIKGEHSVGVQNFIIGIKGLMHPVDSNEMVSNLLDGFKHGNIFFKFLQFTTGEISFLKDFILNMGDIKDEVIKNRTNSRWWSTLKRRKDIKRAKKGGVLPNSSIVCSIEEINELREVYGLNLLDVKHVKKVMDRYFLLGFVIVDESQELAHIIFDGEENYQVLTYKGLEKENNNKNDFKEIYKMINSGRI